ncbi:hypothetical protein KAFR_0D02100 [Kazachstania africana CBS 2517]|uniref:Phosphatidate phosphatase APP1 catalytic domain-containing protein n=1 Tax=Kazachstania africana (strain ATCC 22294 / BCRC 22015 / CBS 2517 / CECT 1963 / NBRC 1671 / NRRL Y-8276) TaxID=1071382 RepID=H2AU07_KAZAF|nr:hypothetical protein KAFR_0D02100 [Kazachstania africana CBS 2517]CCF57857.1 hypothetical protein KAFR_0D02100 [Kazachstania africana CBS 2517]
MSDDQPPIGRKQKFMNLMKTTRDVYIPNIRSTISQKTAEGFRAATTPSEGRVLSHQYPLDMNIRIYPTYTTNLKPNLFETIVRFNVSVPANLNTRKNRLILSLCKQYLRTNEVDDETIEQHFDEAPLDTDTESTSSSRFTSGSKLNLAESVNSTDNNVFQRENTSKKELSVLRERVTDFLSRSVPGVATIIDVSSPDNPEEDKTFFETTDETGNVTVRLQTNYAPSSIRVTLDTPPSYPSLISKAYACNLVNPDGIGLISDIDDTIKHTGITGDKRSMFRNVFVNSAETWVIDKIPLWYNALRNAADASFFYVSNSPIQTFPVLNKYIMDTLPQGPLFLKQYSGSFWSSIMTSSANRKLDTITNILEDFPQKKFILVGDSGEQDFEAYIGTALRYPDQIIGIYIRCCKNSMSDMGLREQEVQKELNNIITRDYSKPLSSTPSSTNISPRKRPPPPPVPRKTFQLSSDQLSEIDRSRSSPAHSSDTIINDGMIETPPRLPLRKPSSSQFSNPGSSIQTVPSTLSDYDTTDLYFDRKAETWRGRVSQGIRDLIEIQKFDMGLLFFNDPEQCLEDSMARIRSLQKDNS